MKLIEFDSPQILIDTGSDLVYFSSPHLLETPPAATPCALCGENRPLRTFIDWDLNESEVCYPCYWLEMYHKIAMRKKRPFYYLQKELARAHDIPFD